MNYGLVLSIAMFASTLLVSNAGAEPNGTTAECKEVKEIATLSFALGVAGADENDILEELVLNDMVSEWSGPVVLEFTDLIVADVETRKEEINSMVRTTIQSENFDEGVEEIKAYIETHAEKWYLTCSSIPA